MASLYRRKRWLNVPKLQERFISKVFRSHLPLGVVLAMALSASSNRDGFARRFLQRVQNIEPTITPDATEDALRILKAMKPASDVEKALAGLQRIIRSGYKL